MKIEYWIKHNDQWIQVDYDTYCKFDGVKEHRPSTWRLLLVQSLLEPYRYT